MSLDGDGGHVGQVVSGGAAVESAASLWSRGGQQHRGAGGGGPSRSGRRRRSLSHKSNLFVSNCGNDTTEKFLREKQ